MAIAEPIARAGAVAAAAPLAFAPVALAPALDAPGVRIACLAPFGGSIMLGTEATAATGSGGSIVRVDLTSGTSDEVVALPPPSERDLADWRAAAFSPLAAAPVDPDRAPVGLVTGMATAQGSADDQPCLYVATASLRGGELLRSDTGQGFMRVLSQRRRTPGLAGLGAPVAWDRQLVLTAWAEGDDDDLRLLPQRCVLASSDPSRGDWEAISPPGFGDPDNAGLPVMLAAFGRLHVAASNPTRGFQVWSAARRRGDRKADLWAKGLDLGAYRFAMAGSVASLAAFGGDLYVGITTIPDGLEGVARPAAELVRIDHDGGWEVIAGEPRLTPDGLKVPLAVAGPGLDDPAASRILVAAGVRHVVAASSTGELILSCDGEEWTAEDGLRAALREGESVEALLVAGDDLLVAAGARLLRARLPA